METVRILITGASGFVGKALSPACIAKGYEVVRIVRSHNEKVGDSTFRIDIGKDGNTEQWQTAMQDVDVVVHLAGVAHTDYSSVSNAESFYHQNNVLASQNVITEAHRAGIPRIIFLSSVKAIAERSIVNENGEVLRLSDSQPAQPEDIYGKSKHVAECRLRERAQELGMELTIIRAPLVYGVGQKGNMEKLYKFVVRGYPLPFASINNSRSMISVNNLCDAILKVVESTASVSGSYFVSDIEISTSDLIRAIGLSVHKPARLFNLPNSVLNLLFRLIGKPILLEKLLGSLVVDSSRFRSDFDWAPTERLAAVLAEIGTEQGA